MVVDVWSELKKWMRQQKMSNPKLSSKYSKNAKTCSMRYKRLNVKYVWNSCSFEPWMRLELVCDMTTKAKNSKATGFSNFPEKIIEIMDCNWSVVFDRAECLRWACAKFRHCGSPEKKKRTQIMAKTGHVNIDSSSFRFLQQKKIAKNSGHKQKLVLNRGVFFLNFVQK